MSRRTCISGSRACCGCPRSGAPTDGSLSVGWRSLALGDLGPHKPQPTTLHSPQTTGAPGPSHLGTWDRTNPNPPLSTHHNLRLPHPSRSLRRVGSHKPQPTSSTHHNLGVPQVPGSPRTVPCPWGGDPSHLGTWDRTNPNPPLSTHHNLGVPQVPSTRGPGIVATPNTLNLTTISGASLLKSAPSSKT